jgi:transposase
LTPEIKERITELCKDTWGSSTRMIAKTLNADMNSRGDMGISRSSVQRYIRSTDWGRLAYRQQTGFLLTSKNIEDRLNFCDLVFNTGYCDSTHQSDFLLRHILFTDESIIDLFPKPNKQNTRIRTLDPANRSILQIPKHGLKLMVAGGICANGLTDLHVVESKTTVNGKYYREKILPVYLNAKIRASNCDDISKRTLFYDQNSVVFMQDGAPAHTANETLDYLRATFLDVWSKGIWPGNSPDLNPVEHLWSILQNSVFIAPKPTNREELIDRIKETWNNIPLQHVQRLIFSFPRRILSCMENGGGRTKY